MRFGLDFGTSNTTLAVARDGEVTVLALDPDAGTAMPTVLYLRRSGCSTRS
jgi:molecular chaperone DnaK (HSP70)